MWGGEVWEIHNEFEVFGYSQKLNKTRKSKNLGNIERKIFTRENICKHFGDWGMHKSRLKFTLKIAS